MNIGFLGLGLMGGPMARNILRAGFPVTVWNRSPDKSAPLAAEGAAVAASPAELGADVDLAILMLGNGPAVAEVLLKRGLADALRPGAVAVDMSSIPPAMARSHAARLAERGVEHLDAPVSGGTRGAADATLAIMVGGASEALERARPALEALGRPTRVGGPGAGQVAKLANQIMVAVGLAAVAEGLAFAERNGADPAAVRDAIRGGFAESRLLAEHGDRMIRRDFKPGGANRIFVKDLDTIEAEARASGMRLPAVQAVAALYRAMVERGEGDLDHASILLAIERLTGERAG